MISYKYSEEKIVALAFADLLNDEIAKVILIRGSVESCDEAIHLSKFFGEWWTYHLKETFNFHAKVAPNIEQKNFIILLEDILKKRMIAQNGTMKWITPEL